MSGIVESTMFETLTGPTPAETRGRDSSGERTGINVYADPLPMAHDHSGNPPRSLAESATFETP